MTAIAYPASLPGPTAAPIQSAERRRVSPADGARTTALGQRDRLATQQVAFIFTFAEAAIFRAWWKDTLVYGGAWFAATWPLPQGFVSGVRKFLGTPKWTEYLPNVGWRVEATCEVRGRGADPREPATHIVNLDGVANAGGSSAVGVTLAGLDPAVTYTLSCPAGLTYTALSEASPSEWFIVFKVTDAASVTTSHGSSTPYATPDAARAAYVSETISGSAQYTFWIDDVVNSDNAGGISIQVQG